MSRRSPGPDPSSSSAPWESGPAHPHRRRRRSRDRGADHPRRHRHRRLVGRQRTRRRPDHPGGRARTRPTGSGGHRRPRRLRRRWPGALYHLADLKVGDVIEISDSLATCPPGPSTPHPKPPSRPSSPRSVGNNRTPQTGPRHLRRPLRPRNRPLPRQRIVWATNHLTAQQRRHRVPEAGISLTLRPVRGPLTTNSTTCLVNETKTGTHTGAVRMGRRCESRWDAAGRREAVLARAADPGWLDGENEQP